MEHTRILHYEIGRLLGRGGMGEVYEAVDLDLDRRVALKFIAPALSADAESARRFEREARSAAALSHPHIATLYAYEKDAGRSFIAMELMSGESVRDRLARGPLPVEEALAIARDVASALAQAHRRGIVHRDIKPENLMFDLDGVVKVTDFGLARAAQASRMTMTGTTLGTAAYMAPESTRGAVGAPADVFALGVMLHEMIGGSLPFPGDSPLALLYMIANEPPVPLRVARPGVPEDVEALAARLLAKDPDARPDAASIGKTLAAMTGVTYVPPSAPASESAVTEAIATGPGDLVRRVATEELEAERLPSGETALVPTPRARGRRRWAVLALLPLVAAGAWVAIAGGGRAQAQRRAQAVQLVNLAAALIREGDLAQARTRLEEAHALDRRNGPARVNLANVLHRAGEDDRALRLAAQVSDDATQSPRDRALAHLVQSEIEMDAGAWPSAVQHAYASLALDSSSAYPYNQLGYALIRAGRAAEAKGVLLRALPIYTSEPALHKNLGLAQLTLGETEPALTEAGIALEQQADYAAAVGLQARALARRGDLVRARAAWARYVGLGPTPGDSAEVAADLGQRGVFR